MNVKQLIDQELQRLQSAGGRGLLQATVDGGQVEADLLALDAIGCSFQTLAYVTEKLADASLERLRQVSGALTARLTYLLEPIGIVEADRDRCSVQLRSNPPKRGEDGASYYELLVRRGGDVSLSRYQKRPGELRQIVPANVTREVLQRLAEDFVAAVG